MGERTLLLLRWGAGLVYIAAAGVLGWYYFTFDKTNLEVVKRTQTSFYSKLQPRWTTPELSRMTEQLLAESTDEFDLLVLRTALGRWRLREQAPSAYDRLLKSYENGYWRDSFADELTEELESIDARWIEARAKVLQRGMKRGQLSLKPAGSQGFVVQFAPGIATADIGSLMEITIISNSGAPPPFLFAAWTTVLDSEVRPYRQRMCPVDDTGQTSGSKKLYKVTMDMSDSPVWLNPMTQPDWIIFHADRELDLTATSYRLGDSITLQVKQ